MVPSGLCLTESEGNPGEIVAALGTLDGIEFPLKKRKTGNFVKGKVIQGG